MSDTKLHDMPCPECGHSTMGHDYESICWATTDCDCEMSRDEVAQSNHERIVAARVGEARRAAALEVLRDLDGTMVTKDDPIGYAGTFMAAIHGGDTGEPSDWREAWEWSDKFTAALRAADAPLSNQEATP